MTSFDLKISKTALDFRLCVTSGQVFRWDEIEPDRWLGVDGNNWYDVSVDGEEYTVKTNASQSAFRDLLRLDEDVEQHCKQIVSNAPELAEYIDSLAGLRLMKPSDSVEETFCFLCTSNNHIARILTMVRSLASFGEPMAEALGQPVQRFPAIQVIAEIEESHLRELGFGYRARTIPAAAREMLSRGGTEWLESLKAEPYEKAHKELVTLSGIGPKLADCICLFALHHTQAVPVDTHLWQAAVRLYFPEWKEKSLTASRYQAIGDRFRADHGELAGWAHQYLFYDNMKNWRNSRKG